MGHGEFIWADLSAHAASTSRAFYANVFGWSFDGSPEYRMASSNNRAVVDHYQMPQKFIDIGMPAFWMSYIAVDSVEDTASLAQSLGAKVELGPEEFEGGGTYALIRDPLGAGFTVFSGPPLGELSNQPNHRLGHGLFVSSASAVVPFYEQLFGWSFGPAADGQTKVRTNGGYEFFLHEIPDPAIRGKEEFWAVFFAVPSLKTAQTTIQKSGGSFLSEMTLPEGNAALTRDPDGGAFIIVESSSPLKLMPHFPWKAWAGLALSVILVLTNQLWPWAIFFSVWVFEALRTKETYLFERVTRSDNAFLYWCLIAFYGALAILCLPVWGDLG